MQNLRLAVSLLLAIACQPEPDPPANTGWEEVPDGDVADDESSITNGKADSNDPAVVALLIKSPSSNSLSLCTAELIAPRLLLTAAHCVATSENGRDAIYRVFTGGDIGKPSGGTWVGVDAVHAHSRFNPARPQDGYDIGVVVLSEPMDVPPLRIQLGPPPEDVRGRRVRIIGYGLDDSAHQTGAGVRRQATTTLIDMTDRLIELGDIKHDTCNGDSGGPTLLKENGAEVLIGITSFGPLDCAGHGFDTRIDRYHEFINQYLSSP